MPWYSRLYPAPKLVFVAPICEICSNLLENVSFATPKTAQKQLSDMPE